MVFKKKENVSIKDKSELDGFFLTFNCSFYTLGRETELRNYFAAQKKTTESFIC